MIASASPRAEEREEARDDDARAEAADGAAAAAQEAEDDGDEDATLVALVDPPRRARPPVVICSSGAVVGFVRAVPCVQMWLSAIFAEPMHALERQPAQAVLRVDLGARERAENVAAAHRRREQPSVSQQLAPPKHRSQWMHRDPRDPRVGPRGAAAPHATPAESAGATER